MNNEEINNIVKAGVVPSKEEYFIADYIFNNDDSIIILAKPRDYGMILKE